MHALTLVAPIAGISGGKILGSAGIVAIAAAATIMFVAGLRGSDKIKIDNKVKALWWGISVGQLWILAGGTLAEFGGGVHEVSNGVFGGPEILGSAPGQGGVCLILFAIAYSFRWKRMVYPAVTALALGVGMAEAGGIWAIIANVIRMVVTALVAKVA
ncbi:hypothetical protein JHN59_40045 [Streptomyces sp. MBT49]|uniref:hypothetical protein n=1 Tax=unclassified Streptomyces TaxID=2593676 RepID=UPI00190B32C4|nr:MULTISPECIES: hypothetical protein [unclassified Streptomyces]MBK3630879.1 hypothetical protein [Streptomyces sp. MBT49]MBK3638172.1 hypothetical protein [Streptomyces sp. MBT97]